jgi:hypothetical protein
LQAHQRDALFLEEFHQGVEIFHAPGEAIQLVDDDGLHLELCHEGKEILQTRAFQDLGAHAFIANDLREHPVFDYCIGLDLGLLGG